MDNDAQGAKRSEHTRRVKRAVELMMSDADCRMVIAEWLSLSGFLATANGGEDASTLSFFEGKRFMGLKIVSTLNSVSPQYFTKLLEEKYGR